MKELRAACEREVHQCFNEASERYPEYAHLFDVPIKWSTRMTSCAGMAQPAYSSYDRRVRIGEYIKLSLPLLETERENFIKRTPGHEAAHIITWIVFGARGHGWQWKMVARELGIADTRCHRYKTPARKRRDRFRVYCSCSHNSVTKVILDRMKRGVKYRCKRCRQCLSLSGIQGAFGTSGYMSIIEMADKKA